MPVNPCPASRMCRASSPNVIRSGVALKSSSAAGKSSTACAVSWRTVFHESSTVSFLTIDFHCTRASVIMRRKEHYLSLYFEDFGIGVEHVTRGRTITEADIVNFAGLSGDFMELHTNEE